MDLTRRGFVAGAALGGAAVAGAFSGLNVQNAIAETGAGLVYQGTARGMRGFITVDVTLDGEKIVDVHVAGNSETPRAISEAAVAVVPRAIVDAQTVNVDGVTGATLSSMAIMSATAQALEAAGVADKFSGEAPAREVEPAQDAECDILVVGSGIGGCSAAIAARWATYGKELNDLKVMMVEECGFVGGTTMCSQGYVFALAPFDDPSHIDEHLYEAYEAWTDPEYPMSTELFRKMMELSGANILDMQKLGMPMYTADGYAAPTGFDDYIAWTHPFLYEPPDLTCGSWPYGGIIYRDYFMQRIYDQGIEVRVDTKATELVLEDGAVTGVQVEGPGGAYTIKAKKVILATGGFCNNAELIAAYLPDYVNARPWCAAGGNGDGLIMAQAAGGVIDGMNYPGLEFGVDLIDGFWGDLGSCFPRGHKVVLVNNEGKRFMDESLVLEDKGQSNISDQPDGQAWTIFDSANTAAPLAEATGRPERIFKADTIAELADAIGVPADALSATIDAYNAAQASGADDGEFGVANENMSPVATAPFYAVPSIATNSWTFVGLRVGDGMEVLTEAGEPIPNLYAAGEVAYTGKKMGCLSGGLANGRIAGESARDAIA